MRKKYPSYKPSGVEWIGSVPAHWEVKKMKYLVEKIDVPTADSDFVVAVENIKSHTGKLTFEGEQIRYEGQLFAFRKGDVLFNKLRPYLTKVYLAEKDGAMYGELLILRAKTGVDPSFLFYRLFSYDFIQEVNSSTEGTKMPRANWEDFIKHLRMALPSLKEQRWIADFLIDKVEAIENAVKKKKQLIDLLQEEKTALINHAVTKGIDAGAPMKPSGVEWLGDIPAHWEIQKLGRVATITRLAGYEYTEYWEPKEDGEITALRGFNIGFNQLQKMDNVEKISNTLSNRLVRSRLFVNDIVYPCVGTIGKAYLVQENDKYHINQNIAKLTPSAEVNPFFLAYFLLCDACMFQVYYFNTSDAQPSILVGNLRRFKLPLPPIQEQIKIANYITEALEKMDVTISNIEREIELLDEFKQSLIYEVVTGKVKVDAPVEEPEPIL